MDPAVIVTAHFRWDVILWLVFFCGQCVYILKRAAMAIRSKTNPIKSRRAFLYANWDILAIRSTVEFILIFYPLRHLNMGTLASLMHFTLPSWIPTDGHLGAWGFFACGIASDVLLDWIGENDKVPNVIRQFIKENVPNVPAAVALTPPPPGS